MTFANIGSVLSAVEPLLRGEEGALDHLHVDLTSVSYCSPAAMTIVAAAVERAVANQAFKSGAVYPPNGVQVQQYLQRMDFYNEIGVDIEENFRRHKPFGFRPVVHVENEDVSPAVTSDMAEAVRERHIDLDESTIAALKTCMNELVENVFYHAESPIDALMCLQAYTGKSRTEIVIADAGQGILPCMAEVPEYAAKLTDDYSAIKLATKKNVSAVADKHRGIGLWLATELVKQNKGNMLILSNDGGAVIDEQGVRRCDDHYWPGTLIVVEFRMDQPISLKEIYASGAFPDIDDDDYELDF